VACALVERRWYYYFKTLYYSALTDAWQAHHIFGGAT